MKQQNDMTSLIPRETIFGKPLKLDPKLSPDGKKIAYLAPVNNVMNFYIKTTGEDDDHPITFLMEDISGYYFWSSDKYIVWFQDLSDTSNRHLYRLDVETGEIKELISYKNIKLTLVEHNVRDFPDELIIGINKSNHLLLDLYHIDLITGSLRLMEQNSGNVMRWLVNSRMELRGKVITGGNGIYELIVKDENDIWKKLTEWDLEEQPVTQPLGFSRDNKYIYLIDTKHYNTGRLIKVEIRTGRREILASHNDYDIYTVFLREEGSLYESPAVLFNPDTDAIEAVSFNKFRREWIILDDNIKEDFQAIKKLNKGDFSVVSRDNRDNIWIINFENDDCPFTYYVYNRKEKNGSFLFYSHPDFNSYRLSSMEEVTFSSRDGLTIHGYITYPSGKKKKNLPVVLCVHKGPWFRDTWGYRPVSQWFASRGYACLQINYRGSIGYGKEFLNAGNKEWGGKMQDDLLDAVKWAIDKGIANSKKIAIYGSGYGGYAALAGAAFTPDVFACAIAIGCPGNLVTFLETILQTAPSNFRDCRNNFIKRIGDPIADKELLISRSPFYKLEQIKIPLLIAHGFKNQRIKSEETYEVVRYLRSKGIEVEYLVFQDEGYYITRKKNLMRLYGRAERFLSRCLGGRCEDIECQMPNSNKDVFNDKHIIDKILLQGDRTAFEDLLKYYEKPLLKYLFNLTGDPFLSMELLHETFCRIWLYMDSYSTDMPFHSWMFKVANNVVKKYRIKESNISIEINVDDIDLDSITEGYKKKIEDKIFIQSMVNSLREPYKTALKLHFSEGLDCKEIASIMKTKPESIKNYLFRARKALGKIWIEKGGI